MAASLPPTTIPRGAPPMLCRALATIPALNVAKGEIFAADPDGARREDPRRRIPASQFWGYWEAGKIDLAWGQISRLPPAEVGALRRAGVIVEWGR